MMKIEKVKISLIKANSNNPRVIKDDKFKKLVKSIQDFPQMLEARPIVVDENMIVLGGNMRLRACKEAGLKEVHIIKASELTEDQKKEFIIKDNASFGDWDWSIISSNEEWDVDKLNEWGIDVIGFDTGDVDDLTDEFSLKDGDKEPIQSMNFTLADEQVEVIKNALADAKKLEEYKYIETMGNENSNGNALYLIITQWVEQRK